MDVREKLSNEKRLIDANELLKNGLRAGYGFDNDGVLLIPMGDVIRSIKKAPTIDAVEVVRCKDCKNRYEDSWCEYVDDDDNFYCARGEREEGDE